MHSMGSNIMTGDTTPLWSPLSRYVVSYTHSSPHRLEVNREQSKDFRPVFTPLGQVLNEAYETGTPLHNEESHRIDQATAPAYDLWPVRERKPTYDPRITPPWLRSPDNIHLIRPPSVVSKTDSVQPAPVAPYNRLPATTVATNPPRPAQPPQRASTRNWKRGLGKITLLAACLTVLAAGAGTYNYLSDIRANLPVLPDSPALIEPTSSVILDASGGVLVHVYKEHREWVPLEEMSTTILEALVATEDHRFYDHRGVDYYRLAGATWSTIGGTPQGASTIPMQMARNAFPDVASSSRLDRKVKEMILARRIEDRFTKPEILEWYLNTVSFGNNSFGIEAASSTYFSKKARDLNLSEAALLVGMLKGPSRYDPFRRSKLALERRNLVIRRLLETGKISLTTARKVSGAPLGLNPSFYDPAKSPAPFFTEYVRKQAQAWARENNYDIYRDGLVIHTTLDPRLQELAERAVVRQSDFLQKIVDDEWSRPRSGSNSSDRGNFDYFWASHRLMETSLIKKSGRYGATVDLGINPLTAVNRLRSDPVFMDSLHSVESRLGAGLVALDPKSGYIRAWVGGRDFSISQFDKVVSARRQPGSTFKPILYAAALEKGFSPYYLVEDRIRTFYTGSNNKEWRPTNSGGGASGRLVSLRQGLAWSKNTVSAHLISRIGPQYVSQLAQKMGIQSPIMPVPSLALGTSEVSLLELVNTYATLSSNGLRKQPIAITHIEDRFGNTVVTFSSDPERALSEQTAFTIVSMLQDVVEPGGTGSFIRTRFGLRGELAGKTGTTQNNADGWFILMHQNLIAGAWVGFNDQRIAFRSNYWGQGGHNALLLVGDFFRQAERDPESGIEPGSFDPPEGYIVPRPPVRPSPTSIDSTGVLFKDQAVRPMTPRSSYFPPIETFR